MAWKKRALRRASMSVPLPTRPPAAQPSDKLGSGRESITYFRPMEDREADYAPLSVKLIRRMFTYTGTTGAAELALILTFARGLQLPALAWMIGETINGRSPDETCPAFTCTRAST